jgi:hypothetical protein
LAVKLEYEAGDDLTGQGFWIALGVAVVALAIFGYFFYTWVDKKTFDTAGLVGMACAGIFGAAGIFFLVWWLFGIFYEPEEDIIQQVKPADQVRINAGHVTVLGLISFALFKHFGKKAREQQTAISVSGEEEEEEDDIVNSLE